MSAPVLFYYSSKGPLHPTSSSLSEDLLELFTSHAPQTGHVSHYEAIEAVAKGAQPYVSLCLDTSLNSIGDDEPRSVPLLENAGPNLSEGSPVILKRSDIMDWRGL